ncbi:DDE-type integrase/transposase/recombinase [uncultured Megasphaera sp.]|uniref:DDE-type integrase/transposase/recombinase n=1 Tax=uncultured Megasphaera sp. TaxID=165188 RepID=UPI00288A83D4|nr:DDE-type integrase/transposase/recombinase [uncultured Megasphaera sp.]
MKIITEEMRFRQRLCEYAIKYGITRTARKYHTNRQFVYRQLKKYDGTVRSLALKSRRPHSSLKAHNKEELALIQQLLKCNSVYGLSEVYVRCREKGYKRSFTGMCRQIRKKGYKKPTIRRKSYSKYERMDGRYAGDKVQIDIKYVPDECIRFPSYGNRYYQITGIDEYSRKRVLKIVKEKSTYETGKYLMELEEKMGFPIRMIQVDNGYEFVNDDERTAKDSAFEKIAKALHMELRRTGPYSPWQNGKVERSHREDGKILYGRKVVTSEQKLIRQVAKHEARYNKTAKTGLNFKNPHQVVSEYFSMCNICVDN